MTQGSNPIRETLWDPIAGFGVAADLQEIEDSSALGYVAEPRTIFSTASKLSPGHTLVVQRGQRLPAPRCYWDVRFTADAKISEPAAQGGRGAEEGDAGAR